MKFIDHCKIKVEAGRGGNGIIAFHRALYVPKGGPSGGSGGRGGNIYFIGSNNKSSLLDFKYKSLIKGENGSNGQIKNKTGANGNDTYIKVPVGTIVKNGNKVIANITNTTEKFIIATGGQGGRGNAAFKTGSNNAPRLCENGSKGESLDLTLELKLIADVGIIGYPNAGKSTLISVISGARPLIADYPFTTITPNLGVVKTKSLETFVVADIPGLIDGAFAGKGLGIQFLKHIERSKIILHLLDGEPNNADIIYEKYLKINVELKKYSKALSNKKQIVCLNKIDSMDSSQIEKLCEIFSSKNITLFTISAIRKQNLLELIEALFREIKNYTESPDYTNDQKIISLKKLKFEPIEIYKKNKVFYVKSNEVEKIFEKIPLISDQNYLLINKKLQNLGVFEKLIEHGISKGDEVRIYDFHFEWE